MSVQTPPDITPLFPEPPRTKPRVKKLRLLAILAPLAGLALVSTVFGMMMAVASDLPDLETAKEFQTAHNSVLLDDRGRRIGILTSNENRIIVPYEQISPNMRNAIVAIEDKRFWTNSGVDIRGIARAFVQDIIHQGSVQGGSTIAQQFVKNALQAQNRRTLFQKLREAALAYHLTRRWSKQKILTEYLNSIYFGNGAYGIESAARAYFGNDPDHLGCGTPQRPCAAELKPQEAALLAGVVANPSAYDPVAHPQAALARRNLVLLRMYQQGMLPRAAYQQAIGEALPVVQPPHVETKAPYFTTWVRQQVVDRFGAQRAFEGGLKIRTTLDLDLQKAAQDAVAQELPDPAGPSAAIVAIDNRTGEVRAMVGGRNYDTTPFNLATQGQRQPGSSIKPFTLAAALEKGYSPSSIWPSRKRIFTVPHTHGREHFVVNNFESTYVGERSLADGLTYSDNAVYSAVGIKVGTARIAHLAERMGIRTPVSTNYAMTLGGLREGVTPIDMAHAYETFAEHGVRTSGSLGSSEDGPVGIDSVEEPNGKTIENKVQRTQVLPRSVADTATQILQTVVQSGTGTRAAYGGFAAGKTGTTENYGDAWFVGFTDRLTIAVWVGYPNGLKPMKYDFGGKPVEGGTFPAMIWHDFALQAQAIFQERANQARAKKGLPPVTTTTTTPVPAVTAPSATTTTTTPATTTPSGGTQAPKKQSTTPSATPAPTQPAPTTPAPPPTTTTTPTTTTPSGGTGAGGGTSTGAAPPPSG
ncbi:MAG TPA: transglycosylase domain-containing protein [Solirubrobacteraceae bacterium]|nr:transglycosylase domain-containing protein [Solirubrobacteraceae bacterium]